MNITFPKAIIVVTIAYCIMFVTLEKNEPTKNSLPVANVSTSNSTTSISNTTNQSTSLASVKSWFEGEKYSVSSAFEEYLNSQTLNSSKIFNTKVTDTTLKFDEDLGCYYLIYFKCKVGTYNCTGHSRAFLKYKDDTLHWWSLEIDYKNTVLIDDYDYSYEDIVVNYYKELARTYQ